MTVILKDEQSLNSFIAEAKKFEKLSGLELNPTKTTALSLNNSVTFDLPLNIKWNNKPTKVLGVYIGNNMHECNRKTISEAIKSMKNVINSWKSRKLTLKGKILILKTLVISKFTHIANLIPIDDDSIKEIEQIIYEYIWNGKTHKVRKSVITQTHELGGRNMIDVKTMITAQKLKWVKQYLSNHQAQWSKLMESLINVRNLNFFLISNFDLTTIWTKSFFYGEVLRILFELNKKNHFQLKENLYNQILYYNRFVKPDNKYVYDIEFALAGVWRVSDLFDENNKPIPFETLTHRGISTSRYMMWRQIMAKIQHIRKERQVECDYDLKIDLPSGEKININTANSKEIYNKLLILLGEIPPSIEKFSHLFTHFDPSMAKTMFMIPLKCTKNNQIHDFQFQILHKYLPTNKLLFKMGKIAAMSCTLCNLHPESVVHLFYDCVCVKGLWMYVETLLETLETHPIKLTPQDIILGFGLHLDKPSAYTDLNKLILYAKYYIWICRKNSENVLVNRFVTWFRDFQSVDKSLETITEVM